MRIPFSRSSWIRIGLQAFFAGFVLLSGIHANDCILVNSESSKNYTNFDLVQESK
jgi:hypothetical protein